MKRSREEAEKTRESIVDAGLDCFDRHGIASSTMEQIAERAKVTRGAVYHYFSNKDEILRAIRAQVSLPLLDEADTTLLRHPEMAPLERVERFMEKFLHALERDVRLRRAWAVMHFKCEYVKALAGDLDGLILNHDRLVNALEATYREARKDGTLAKGLVPRAAAVESMMFVAGMVRLWLLDSRSTGLRKDARAAIRAHIQSRRS
jgi:AcrR family transcriptional regulator